jgi:hypothetical protein
MHDANPTFFLNDLARDRRRFIVDIRPENLCALPRQEHGSSLSIAPTGANRSNTSNNGDLSSQIEHCVSLSPAAAPDTNGNIKIAYLQAPTRKQMIPWRQTTVSPSRRYTVTGFCIAATDLAETLSRCQEFIVQNSVANDCRRRARLAFRD